MTASTGVVVLGLTIGGVGGRVVGGTVARTSDHSDWGYYSNEEHHDTHNNSDVEADTGASAVLLRPSSGPQGHDRPDEGGNGERKADERRATRDQGAEGKHQSTNSHSRVILLRRRHASGGRGHRLCRYHNGSVGELRLVVVGGLILLVDVDVGWRRPLRRVGWRKVGLRGIALGRIALDRRRRVLRGGALVLRRVAIGHLGRVDRLSFWLVGLLVGMTRGGHSL